MIEIVNLLNNDNKKSTSISSAVSVTCTVSAVLRSSWYNLNSTKKKRDDKSDNGKWNLIEDKRFCLLFIRI